MERQKHPRQCKAPKPPEPELERKTRSMTSTGQVKRKATSPSPISGPANKKKPTLSSVRIDPKTREVAERDEYVQRKVADLVRSIQEAERARQMRNASQVSSQLVKFHINVPRKATTNEQTPSSSLEANNVRQNSPPPDITRKRHFGTSIVDHQVPVSSRQFSSRCSIAQGVITDGMRTAPSSSRQFSLYVPREANHVNPRQVAPPLDVLQKGQVRASLVDKHSSSSSHQVSLQPENLQKANYAKMKSSIGNGQAPSNSHQFSLYVPRVTPPPNGPPEGQVRAPASSVPSVVDHVIDEPTRPEESSHFPISERLVGDVVRERLENSSDYSEGRQLAPPVFLPPEASKMVVPVQNKTFVPKKAIQHPPRAITSSRPSQLCRGIPGKQPEGQLVSRKQQTIQASCSSKTVPPAPTFSKTHPRLVQLVTPQRSLAAPGPQEPLTVPAQALTEVPISPSNQNTLPPVTLPTFAQELDIPIENAPCAQNPSASPVQNRTINVETPGDKDSRQLAYRAIRTVGSSVSPAPTPLTLTENSVAQEPLKTSPAIKEEPVFDLDLKIIKHISPPKKSIPKRLPEAKKLILPTGCNTNYEKWTDKNCQEFILKFVESDDLEQIDIIKRLSIDSSALEALTETDDWEKLKIKYKIFCKLRAHFNKVVNVHHGHC